MLAALVASGPSVATAQDGLLAAAPPIAAVDARTLAPGLWRYTTTATVGARTQRVDRTLQISVGALAGAPVWILAESQRGTDGSIVDSLYLTRTDARPLRHVMQRGADRLVMHDFSRDSIHGSVMTPDGRAVPVATGYRAGPMVSGSMLEVMLRLLPLAPGWRATTQMLAAGPQGNLLVPLELSVAGEETVSVPAGSFPSWVVLIRAQNSEQRLWVAKRGRQLVRLTTSARPGMTVETVLLPEQAPK